MARNPARTAATYAVGLLMLGFASTGAKAEDICGRPYTSVQQSYTEISQLKEIETLRNDHEYIAISDKTTKFVWTFVTTRHPAGPAVVCRQLIEHEKRFYVKMDVRCNGPKKECDALVEAFQAMLPKGEKATGVAAARR